MRRVLLPLGLILSASVVVGLGCGTSHRAAFVDDAGDLDAGLVDTGPGFADDAPTPDPNCTGNHCSSDLHSLVDCFGNVVSSCPPDQGCFGTTCVPACESAKDNKTSIGCDYYDIEPDVIFGLSGCFTSFVANTWSTPVTLSVEYDGNTLDPSTFGYIPSGTGAGTTYAPLVNAQIPAGQVAILFLDMIPGAGGFIHTECPASVNTAIKTGPAAHGTGINKAFRISATAPVVAYDIFPYGGGQSALTSATLLLPTSAWDTNYIAVDAWTSGSGQPGEQPFLQIVAQEDGTQVQIKPASAIAGGPGVAAAAKGSVAPYTINKGQVLQLTQDAPLVGSVIQSDKAIGVWGGKTGLTIESCCGETAHQQIPPVRALGSEYVGVRYRDRYDGRVESPPWRVIGAVDGTVLTWEPSTPPGAPVNVTIGDVIQFDAPGPFVVRSQDANHPFYMSAHMTGAGNFDPGNDGRGDAEFVNMIPPAEYLNSYVFFADPTYPETNLVLVRRKGAGGFSDVTLDCAGVVGGWAPLGTSGTYQFTHVDLVRHNFESQNGCTNGRREIHSLNPFGVTVWGWGSKESGSFNSQYVSYAYPAGAGVAPINNVVIPPSVK